MEDRMAKHAKVCEKVFVKKRKAYKMSEFRMDEEQKKAITQETKEEAVKRKKAHEKTAKWKEKSEQFRNAIQQARACGEAEKKGLPMPEAVPTNPSLDDRVECPHCLRKFNEDVAERHIPKCERRKN